MGGFGNKPVESLSLEDLQVCLDWAFYGVVSFFIEVIILQKEELVFFTFCLVNILWIIKGLG